jgi:hypothetical protein
MFTKVSNMFDDMLANYGIYDNSQWIKTNIKELESVLAFHKSCLFPMRLLNHPDCAIIPKTANLHASIY